MIIGLRLIKKKIDLYLFYGDNKWKFIKPYMLNDFLYFLLSSRCLNFQEGEHQIGRLKNMERIFHQIKKEKIDGDIVEFGSYQGFSLYWLVYFRNKYKLHNKKIIAIDSFAGLPESSTIWKKRQFSDTSIELLQNNLTNKLKINSLEENNVFIIKGYFNDPQVSNKLKGITNLLALLHIDCDLGSSCDMALEVANNTGLNRKYFLLFDDFGCHPDEIPRSFEKYVCKYHTNRYHEIFNTKYTKYFMVVEN